MKNLSSLCTGSNLDPLTKHECEKLKNLIRQLRKLLHNVSERIQLYQNKLGQTIDIINSQSTSVES